MEYLVDTNIFFHVINSNVFGVAQLCKSKGNDICITQTIIDELEPGHQREVEEETARDIYNCVNNLVTGKTGFKVIKVLDMAKIEGAKERFKEIRKRYYGWMTDSLYLQKMVSEEKLTAEEIRSPRFKKKDMGECELIAIAEVSGDKYLIVTDDKGRVYKHPDINIFDTYAKDVPVLSGKEWIEKIEYVEEQNSLGLSS